MHYFSRYLEADIQVSFKKFWFGFNNFWLGIFADKKKNINQQELKIGMTHSLFFSMKTIYKEIKKGEHSYEILKLNKVLAFQEQNLMVFLSLGLPDILSGFLFHHVHLEFRATLILFSYSYIVQCSPLLSTFYKAAFFSAGSSSSFNQTFWVY